MPKLGSIIYHMTLKYFLHAKSQDYAIYMCYVLHYMTRHLVRTQKKNVYILFNQNMCCGYSKEQSQ